jgi:nitronate monooxygenase
VEDKTCLCTQFRNFKIWTCGQNVYRLKDTTYKLEDGKYQLLRAEDVFNDYQFSKDHMIKLPERKAATTSEISLAAA